MYRRILVPLDGSELAECVLPHVEDIAKGCGVESVVIMRVLDNVPGWVENYLNEEQRTEADKRAETSVREYLDEVASRVKLDGVEVQKQFITGHPAESIADYATKSDIDLIIIATHGRSGISRWVWGGVADRILRSACVPVLMVRAPGCIPG